ncbi:hypothetical protein D3C80_823890 [compost metagenome]
MVLELAALGAFDGPVAGVVHARGDLVGLQAAVDFEELEGQHADIVELLEHAAGVVFGQALEQMIFTGNRQAQNAVLVGVVHQRIETSFAITGTHSDQRHFTGERYKAFQQARNATQFSESTDNILGSSQYFLAFAVITQGTGFQHSRQANARHCGVQVGLRLDIGE